MSDQPDDAQKTEEPTSKRLRDAREKGQVATSRELNTWIILFGTGLLIAMAAPAMFRDLRDLLSGFISRPHSISADAGNLGDVLTGFLFELLLIMAIPFAVLFFLALTAGLVQNGLLFAVKQLEPKLDKLSLLKGLQRLFSMRQMVEFAKGMLKIVLIGAVGVILLLPEIGRLDTIPTMEAGEVLDEISTLVLRVFAAVLAILLAITLVDVVFQRLQHRKQLRMTKQEVKEEFKNTEGDPQIKSRLRQIRVERARRRMMQAVPEADVVVTNPTHFAVALAYDPEEMEAPRCVAKGQDLVAQRIRDVAEENEVPVVENPPLARALYASVEVDEFIPPEHYETVAKIISYVFNLKGKVMPA